MTPEEKMTPISVRPLLYHFVRAALTLAEKVIDDLPFEDLANHQFYVARLCGESWNDPRGSGLVTGNRYEAVRNERFYVKVSTESHFEIVASEVK
jgi:hypothetical protein